MPSDAANHGRLSGGRPLDAGQVDEAAHRLAESHTVSRQARPGASPLGRLQKHGAVLREAYDYFVQVSGAQGGVSHAAEWLLDNFYVVQHELRQVRQDMPGGYYRRLPKLDKSAWKGYPRIYALAREIIERAKGDLNIDQVKEFVQSYQQVAPLTMGELWALPTMLRLGILELLARWAARVVGLRAGASRDPQAEASSPNDLVEEKSVASCILSLRTLAVQDWKVFFEEVSRVEEFLRSDPAGIYTRMDFDTRDRYRKVVEQLALATGRGEEEIAREAIHLAEEACRGAQGSTRTSHVGFYLLDRGRAKLEARINYRPGRWARVRRWAGDHPTVVYLGAIGLFTLIVLLGLVGYALVARGTPGQIVVVALLSLLPAVTAAVCLVNLLVTHLVPPRMLPKMDFRTGIPAEYRTMVVVPALIASVGEVDPLLRQLELHFLGNMDPQLRFALLLQFIDAPEQHMPKDQPLIEQAQRGVQTLNQKYGRGSPGPFHFFYRERQWNPAQGCWMGWERKRGALVEFNRLLNRSQDTTFRVSMEDLDALPEIRYVITLDSDTALPRDSARQLIATLAHPLNQAEFAPDGSTVVAGYTVLQPRVEIKPTSATRSLFTRLFAGDTGLDLYTRAVSDVYQDLFGEGIFVGKGIYNLVAFERSLAGGVPENTLLSHDLFEGIHGRAGLVTDVVLYEDYPPCYFSYMQRLHRWVRGDWQLLPWLFPRVPFAGKGSIRSRLSVIDRWKILDNLRRSLRAPAFLALLVVGWVWLPGSAWVWTLTGLLTPAMPLVTGFGVRLARRLWGKPRPPVALSLWEGVARWLLSLVFLPHAALLMLDATGRTLARLFITHKLRLQWTTAAHVLRLFGKRRRLPLIWKRMGGAPLIALAVALLVGLIAPGVLPLAAPLLLSWFLSPLVAFWISLPLAREQVSMSAEQLQQLRCLARRTWHYFEYFVGPDDHWLPPDHFQEDPRGLVAHRTSPTNLGLLLVSTLAAYDLGYIGPVDLTLRLRATFETLGRMERYRGHFLNWYDTSSLEPLPPRYLSTVDSGNLAGCLLVLQQGLLAVPQGTLLRWQCWQGLLDTLDVLVKVVENVRGEGVDVDVAPLLELIAHIRQHVSAMQDVPEQWPDLLARLNGEDWPALESLLLALVNVPTLDTATLGDLHIWSERLRHHLVCLERELDWVVPWLGPMRKVPALFTQADADPALRSAWQALQDALPAAPRLAQVPEVCNLGQERLGQLRSLLSTAVGPAEGEEEAHAWCGELAKKLASAQTAVDGFLADLQGLSQQAEALFQAMDFAFLFDPQRQVFHLGYNVAISSLDSNHYDLLASEARIASLVAIAKGDVPQSHWLHLERPITQADGRRVLLSWNGSMFEYLMPDLFMRSYEGSLLNQTSRGVVQSQIAYGRQQGVPWGIAESGYYRFDANLNYQYRGFGIPVLGRKRGLAEDLVVTPYASMLALPFYPGAVMQNIARLIADGMLGSYGFYEAVDYTRSRLPAGEKRAIVRSYMAHHQGMSLLSLTNYLQEGVIVRRFHADPRVQSLELLLQEYVPGQAPVEEVLEEVARAARPVSTRVVIEPWRAAVDAPLPQVHLLSNGRYGVLITSTGGGYSYWKTGQGEGHQEVALTRWRADTALDNWGTWIYVQDQDSGALWSAGYQPTASPPEEQEVLFHAHKVEFRRRDHGVSLHMEVAVVPGDNVEIRQVFLTNHSNRSRRLVVTSYGEVVLAPLASDRRHPAFSKLFVESEYLPELNAQIFRRRPRSAEEEPVYLVHLLVVKQEVKSPAAHESDRARFLGRGQSTRSPAALGPDGAGLSGTTGATLDPIMALGQEIELGPYGEVHLAYITAAAGSREEALALARRYQEYCVIQRALVQAHAQSEQQLRQLGLGTSDLQTMDQLLATLLYPYRALRTDAKTLAANRKGQSGLWSYAISGDYPVLLVRVGSPEGMPLVRELLRAHTCWREQRVLVDLVILNEQDIGYTQELQEQLQWLITRVGSEAWLNQRGGIFLLRTGQMGQEDLVLLETAARAVLDGQRGSLAEQVAVLGMRPTYLPHFAPTESSREDPEPTVPLARPVGLLFDNGYGGFRADGREYVIYLEPGQWTPAPWINVVANPRFGFLVSEAGGGYTWAESSGENRLTPWSNDPVSDGLGEALYLRDEETAQVWSPTPLPVSAPAPYLVRHGAGYSVFEHHSHGLKQRLRLFAAPDAPVKVVQLRLENTWNRNRRITATLYVEWVLGTTREETQPYIVPDYDAASCALLARNPYSKEFGERVAFVAASKKIHGLTADRTEFLGREGSYRRPAALDRVGLAGTVEAGRDPCAAMQLHIELTPGEAKEIFFLLGQGADREEALQLVKQHQGTERIEAVWKSVAHFWDGFLETVTVQTPDPALDLLLNRWLLYQTISCRLWARSAFYQSSGTFGYRDQLQDVMALLHTTPGLAREHILRAARHQFEAGDVLHWWHPPSGRGVRTRISDDMLWLPFVTAHYVATTGDESILSERVPFVIGDPLSTEEAERYGDYETTPGSFSLYEHCRRALGKGSTAGPRGLPLIGRGDWNDSLNRVGEAGRGESVWLGWFLCATLAHFASLSERMGYADEAAVCRRHADALRQVIELHSWDGGWYHGAYYDDGTPLGSAGSRECQIDSIAQSWAVLSGGAGRERAVQAMQAVVERLVQRDDQLLLLLAPPFDRTPRDPGYIKAYPPGIRENGGQYTHAALWAVWALAELGQGDQATALLRLLNPIYHADAKGTDCYRVEPYVVAADVYSVTPHAGRGGWTWYTGSSGWMYRLGLEAILGLRREGKVLRVDPCIPSDWPGYEVAYREGGTMYRIRVENPSGVNRGVKQATLDGEVLPENRIPLLDDRRQHNVHVLMG